MDQAIEILAEKGSAKLIEFEPLRTFNVTLPPGATFVVANTLEEKNKAASNDFNTRVVECRWVLLVLLYYVNIFCTIEHNYYHTELLIDDRNGRNSF